MSRNLNVPVPRTSNSVEDKIEIETALYHGSYRKWARRDFLGFTVASVGGLGMGTKSQAAVSRGSGESLLVDVNVSLSSWPLRRLPSDATEALVKKLRSRGVTQAWTGNFDALLHKDLASANSRLVEECQTHGRGLLLPFGTVNPTTPDWEEDLRRCALVHRMRGIRLHPNYHGYTLSDARFVHLLEAATTYRLIVQIAILMEDERMMHPRLRVDPVDTAPLAEAVRRIPEVRLVVVNALGKLRGGALLKLIASGDVSVEISMLEGVGGLGTLIEQGLTRRLLFGSHAPMFYFESAELKLKESPLSPEQLRAVRFENARRLLG